MKFSGAKRSAQRTKRVIACLINAVLPLLWSQGSPAAVDPGMRQQLATASVPFVPNAGQWDLQAAFAAQTFAGTLFVTTQGTLVYSLPGKLIADQVDDTSTGARRRLAHDQNHTTARTPGWVLTETFVGAQQQTISVTPTGYRPAAARVSYFIGNDEHQHQRGLDTFERLDLGEVFPGINVQLRATGSNVEKIFTVAPRQDPSQIQLRIGGATKLELGDQGELIAHTGNGPLTYTAPVAFQEDGQGNRQPVAVRYTLNTRTSDYSFLLAIYDTTRPLVIDPLLQSTYLGAAGNENAYLAIHPVNGDVYVAGSTNSTTTTFPGVSGGAQGSSGGGNDAYVSRFRADLTTLVQSTYLGAAGGEGATALAIHPVSGDVYVAGATDSPASTFPGISGGAQGIFGGDLDAFVSRLSADLTILIKSSYLGAAGYDFATALAINPVSGDVYVAGATESPTTTFPGVSGGAQGFLGGGQDAFVSRFSADLTTLIKSTYLGATGGENANALAIHPASGDVYVAGTTTSPTTTFPGVNGGAQGSYGGATDAFVSRFSADLTTLIKSSYLGAGGADEANALAIHPVSGEVLVAGYTASISPTFPGVSGGAQGTFGGGAWDAFVSRFSADLTTLIKSSYLGAAGSEIAYALAVHPVSGEVYVAGFTDATITFPGVNGGAQGSLGGGRDAFVSRFSADLTTLIQSSYLGAAGTDQAQALAIHPASGEVYVAGFTASTTPNFPGVSGGAQGTFGGNTDAFVSRFSLDLLAADVYPNSFHFAAQANVPMNVMRTSAPVQISGLGSLATVTVSGAPYSAYCVSLGNNCSCDATLGGAFTATPATIANNQFLCARHLSAPIPNATRETVLIVGGGVAKFQTFTGTNFSICSLDVDGNGVNDALTDGLIVLRALFGLTGTSVTNSAIGAGATRTTWTQLRPYLNGNCGTNFAP